MIWTYKSAHNFHSQLQSQIFLSDNHQVLSLIHIYSEDKRRGMTYEFDYDTEELINQFSIKSYYYRASEMKIDWRCV